MKFEFDSDVFKIAFPLFLMGFCLVWWFAGFWVALGVFLISISGNVRRGQ